MNRGLEGCEKLDQGPIFRGCAPAVTQRIRNVVSQLADRDEISD
jgi:hypothetical protein